MMESIKIKSTKSIGVNKIYSIQNNETDLYQDTPNFLVNGFLSKNSKHACVSKEMKVLTSCGYKFAKDIKKPDRIAYIDSKGDIRLTKRYKIHNTGEKRMFELTTITGKTLRVSEDHRFFKEISEGVIKDIKLSDLEEGDKIVVI